jgi:hypothetical protein
MGLLKCLARFYNWMMLRQKLQFTSPKRGNGLFVDFVTTLSLADFCAYISPYVLEKQPTEKCELFHYLMLTNFVVIKINRRNDLKNAHARAKMLLANLQLFFSGLSLIT